MSTRGQFVYVGNCVGSTAEYVTAAVDSGVQVTLATFRRAVGSVRFRSFVEQLGYGRDLPVSKDFAVSFWKGTYRGVPAYWMTWSAIEHFFTLDGEVRV